MLHDDERRRIVCVAGRDDDSLVALRRIRDWQGAWGFGVRALFVTGATEPLDPIQEAGGFRRWAERKASLALADSDVTVCDAENCAAMLDHATDERTGLIACPTPTDMSSPIARISLRTVVDRALALRVPLLTCRHYVYPRRLLVVADGTHKTLPTLRMAFDLAQHLGATMSYLNAFCIRSARLARMAKSPVIVTIKTSGPSRILRVERVASLADAGCGFALRVAKEALRAQADVLVVGISRAEQPSIDQILRIAPCSVLAVPC